MSGQTPLATRLSRGAAFTLASAFALMACSPSKESETPEGGGSAPSAGEGPRFTYANSEEGNEANGSDPPEGTTAAGETSDTSGSCDIEVGILVTVDESGSLNVATKVENVSKSDLSLKWTAACPGAGMGYTGIKPGYDFGNGCAAGVCMGSEEHFTLELRAGQAAAVGHFVVNPKGGSCNKPLSDGTYSVTPTSEIRGGRVCAVKSGSFRVASGRGDVASE